MKSKTKKNSNNNINKKKLWNSFDKSINNKKILECIYRKSGERNNCEICNSILLISDIGYLVCTDKSCGIIYKDTIDQSQEWRFYGADDNKRGDNPTRCGMPINPLLLESSFGCKVICKSRTTYEMRKIKRYTEWQSMPYKEKSQYDEFQRITILAKHGGIPRLIIDDAIRYHKKISEAKSFRGLNRDGIIAASIYVSSKINNYPRTSKEIATIFNLDNTSATRGCKNAMSIINNLEHSMNNNEKTNLCNITPLTFIDRYCSRLNINTELTKVCKFIAIRIQKNGLIPENTPHSIAAGIIYFVSNKCNINVTKKEVNNISEISEVTINKCYKKLDTMKEHLIPKKIYDKYN